MDRDAVPGFVLSTIERDRKGQEHLLTLIRRAHGDNPIITPARILSLCALPDRLPVSRDPSTEPAPP